MWQENGKNSFLKNFWKENGQKGSYHFPTKSPSNFQTNSFRKISYEILSKYVSYGLFPINIICRKMVGNVYFLRIFYVYDRRKTEFFCNPVSDYRSVLISNHQCCYFFFFFLILLPQIRCKIHSLKPNLEWINICN